MPSFSQNVAQVVASIQAGKVLTYSQVAHLAGSLGASRAVGTIMAKNNDKSIPCHRVVCADGSLGAYNGLRGKNKEALLTKEGVRFVGPGKVFVSK